MRSFLIYVSLIFLIAFIEVISSENVHHPFFELIRGNHRSAVALTDEKNAELIQFYLSLQNRFVTTTDFLDGFELGPQSPWNTNVSRDCANDIGFILSAVRQQATWAMQFIDATGKPEAGILRGNLAWLGSFGECRSTVAQMNNETAFKGKYCLPSIGPPINKSAGPEMPNPFGNGMLALRIGICFPDSCTNTDANQIVVNVLSMLPASLNFTLDVYSTLCQPDSYEYDSGSIIVLSVLGVLALILALGTLYDVVIYQPLIKQVAAVTKSRTPVGSSYPPIGSEVNSNGSYASSGETHTDELEDNSVGKQDDDAPLLGKKEVAVKSKVDVDVIISDEIGVWAQLLLVFSLYSNGKKILDVCQPDKALTCIHGIRFLSLTWVILGHSYGFASLAIRDLLVIPGVLGDFWFQAVANATFSVDTFFVMSGLLLTYLFVLAYEKTPRFPVLNFYIHRYWRLTAVYGVIMAVYLFTFKHYNIGPQWTPNGMEVNGCKDTWWLNLLYVNNLFRTSKQCMGWTWYLANDMQFYWISPLILFPLVKWPFAGFASWTIVFVAHIITTAVLCVKYHFSPSLFGNGLTNTSDQTANWDYFNLYYLKPWTRIGPYLIGMLCGYVLAKYRKEKVIKIKTQYVFLLWIVAAASALSVVYGLYDVNNGTTQLSPPVAVLYNVLSRIVWALAVCWVIFACVQGYGGFVNTILSWSAFVPLSRLTYCCYLIHIPVMMVFFLGQTTTIDFSHLEMVYYYFAALFMSFGFAFVFSVGVEVPLLGLEKFVTKLLSRKS